MFDSDYPIRFGTLREFGIDPSDVNTYIVIHLYDSSYPHKKNSYERRDYESVDEKSLS